MVPEPSETLKRAVLQRRLRLAEALDGHAALIASGGQRPRNYHANGYPYRANSHFLYLVGMALPDAFLLVHGTEHTLFVMPPKGDDALWHGPQPTLNHLAQMTGCRVTSLDMLGSALMGIEAGTLLTTDPQTTRAQVAFLGRPFSRLKQRVEDYRLMDAMVALRLVHDEAAIAGLREAAAGTFAAHMAGLHATRVGGYEYEVKAAMQFALERQGMGTAYQPIVTTRGEVLHNNSYHNRLEAGDLLLCDVGAETAGGWAGDVTRVWPVSGRFDGPQLELYQVVLAAQKAAIEVAVPGTRFRAVHDAAVRSMTTGLVELGILRGDVETLIADNVPALFFPHGIGHLIGLDVHDMEDLGKRAGYDPDFERDTQFGASYLRLDRILEPGMAVTIEPGFYQVPALLADPDSRSIFPAGRVDHERLEDFVSVRGIRIEDDLLITADGNEVLTAAIPKEAQEIEAAVGLIQ